MKSSPTLFVDSDQAYLDFLMEVESRTGEVGYLAVPTLPFEVERPIDPIVIHATEGVGTQSLILIRWRPKPQNSLSVVTETCINHAPH